MKLTRSLQIIALSITAVASAITGQSQVYQISGTVDSLPGSYEDGSFMFQIGQGTISETVNINPSGQTIRVTGSLSLPAVAPTFSTHSFTTVVLTPPQFPNPPQTRTISGDLTLSYSSPAHVYNFDTGYQHIFWDGQHWTFSGSGGIAGFPATVSWSLLTDNQTYTGTSDVSINIGFGMGSYLDTSNYPASIALTPEPGMSIQRTELLSLTALNGLHVDLVAVPEPTGVLLMSLGFGVLAVVRLRK